jgi:hypothetical protein
MTGLRYLLDSFQQLHLSGSAPYSTGTQDWMNPYRGPYNKHAATWWHFSTCCLLWWGAAQFYVVYACASYIDTASCSHLIKPILFYASWFTSTGYRDKGMLTMVMPPIITGTNLMIPNDGLCPPKEFPQLAWSRHHVYGPLW